MGDKAQVSAGKKAAEAVAAWDKANQELYKISSNIAKCQAQLKSGDPAHMGKAAAEMGKLMPKMVAAHKKLDAAQKNMEKATEALEKALK